MRDTCGNKKICPNILRHIYVTAMYEHYSEALEGMHGPEAQATAKKEVAKAAHLMAHGLKMHEMYRFDLSEEGEPVPMESIKLTAHDIPLLSAAERNAPLSVRCI